MKVSLKALYSLSAEVAPGLERFVSISQKTDNWDRLEERYQIADNYATDTI
jgi:hypothetical protein